MSFMSSGGAFLYTLTLGVCAGIALALFFTISLLYAGALLFLTALILLVAMLFRKPVLLLVAAGLAALALGLVRTDAFRESEAARSLVRYANETAMLTGTVANDPDVRDTSVRANIDVVSVNGAQAQGTVQAVFAAHTALAYGQVVEVSGVMQAPQAFMGGNGNLFDYPGYLRVQGVSMLLQKATVLQSQPAGFSTLGALYNLKHAFDVSLERALPEPEVSLLEGILLGQRRGLSADLTAMFVAAGLVHIVILSGYSMSVVAESVLRALKFLPKSIAFVTGAI
ncbi:MAG: DUF4131 domain-containing protein, partial [Patescibacteria group bacterium]|nr:DUF4131 domain-containing protein [Patescibacteria group bacterium]